MHWSNLPVTISTLWGACYYPHLYMCRPRPKKVFIYDPSVGGRGFKTWEMTECFHWEREDAAVSCLHIGSAWVQRWGLLGTQVFRVPVTPRFPQEGAHLSPGTEWWSWPELGTTSCPRQRGLLLTIPAPSLVLDWRVSPVEPEGLWQHHQAVHPHRQHLGPRHSHQRVVSTALRCWASR